MGAIKGSSENLLCGSIASVERGVVISLILFAVQSNRL